jgi:hypothetical protein
MEKRNLKCYRRMMKLVFVMASTETLKKYIPATNNKMF